MDERRWKIGELAGATGLTVRALRHYDELGLLVPSERTYAGYRLYSEQDVQRLYRIVALRGLGFPLDEVAAVLDREGSDPRGTLRRQLERLDAEIALQRSLRERVARILDAVEAGPGASSQDYIETIEVMTMIEKHYTPEQLAQLEARADELGPGGMERAQQDWAELIAAVRAERERGTDPTDPRVLELARRWQALVEAFTGGDAGIASSLAQMYDQEGPEQASRGMVDPGLLEYLGRAQAALG